MNYAVSYTKPAEAELLGFPAKMQRQLATKIARLRHGFTGDIKKLQATDNVYRRARGVTGSEVTVRRLLAVRGAHASRVLASASRRHLRSLRRDAADSLRAAGAPREISAVLTLR